MIGEILFLICLVLVAIFTLYGPESVGPIPQECAEPLDQFPELIVRVSPSEPVAAHRDDPVAPVKEKKVRFSRIVNTREFNTSTGEIVREIKDHIIKDNSTGT